MKPTRLTLRREGVAEIKVDKNAPIGAARHDDQLKSRLEGNLYDPFELAVRTHDVDFGQDVMVLHLGKDRGKLLRRFFGAA
ncbi:MAG TPA: hypothetical protein VLD63_12425, partial [Anaerolineales bacterium]|nr:hypothetical protein [Anaerolineales bacterium]